MRNPLRNSTGDDVLFEECKPGRLKSGWMFVCVETICTHVFVGLHKHDWQKHALLKMSNPIFGGILVVCE